MIQVSWEEVRIEAKRIAETWQGKIDYIYGIPQGGAPLAVMISEMLQISLVKYPTEAARTLIVDDLIDSGRTMAKYHGLFPTDAAFRKPHSPTDYAPNAKTIDDWISFPWEKNDGAPSEAIVRLIEWIGDDPSREGLIETPDRVLKAWKELCDGYHQNPAAILAKTFEVGKVDEMVILRDIPFVSFCEHHLLPFEGSADIAYIPKDRVVGLSKLARLVDVYAKRLQVQERLTQDIRQALDDHLDPLASGVVIRASHTCMCYRGIKKKAQMVTSSLSGRLRDDHAARAEFLALTMPR